MVSYWVISSKGNHRIFMLGTQPGFFSTRRPGVAGSTRSARAVWDRMMTVALTLNLAVGFRFVSILRVPTLCQRDEIVLHRT
jgi:hypothetical protein